MQNEITLNEDVQRLTGLLKTKIKDGIDKQLVIYSCFDKRRPPHSLVYNDPDTAQELETKGVLKINKVDNNVDETAAGFASPPYYIVTVLVDKPLPLPEGVEILQTNNQYILRFSDGKQLDFVDANERSARYFKILVDRHGLPVDHDDVLQTIKEVDTAKQIRGIVDAIREKIIRKTLKSRVTIETEMKSAYKLLVTFSPKKTG